MSLLRQICADRRAEIERCKSGRPIGSLEREPLWSQERRAFGATLRRGAGDPIRFLAEIKRASPSAGAIRPGADPAEVAGQYADGGAAAISVLTETRYFDGDPAFLPLTRAAVELPLLMKDFILDEWQVAWARSLGADAVLLIVAALERIALRDLIAASSEIGLDALVEVHSEREAEAAIDAGASLLGVNHRNLATLAIDLSLSERIFPLLPPGTVRVAESGIGGREDVVRLERLGFDALLVGEALMRAPDPAARLRSLRGEDR